MAKVLGKNIVVGMMNQTVFTPIAQAKDCTLTLDTSFVEYASATSGAWKDVKPKTKSWSVTCNGLLCSDHVALWQAFNTRSALTLSFRSPGIIYNGQAYVKTLKESGSVKGMATYSVEFVGTGGLS